MRLPHGFDHFCNFLKGLENHYVIIGGGAAAILMADGGLEFRSTKDVDFIVLGRSDDLITRILTYVRDGGYKTKEATEGHPRYFRFREPSKQECPHYIEIFARNELNLNLEDGQYIIPVKNELAERLSAILLDDEYFELIKKNITYSASGIPLINALANICLKARAHKEILERRLAGDTAADEKVAQKHLKDIWRIAVVLIGDESLSLKGRPRVDFDFAYQSLEKLSDSQFKQVMSGTPTVNKHTLMANLKKIFQ